MRTHWLRLASAPALLLALWLTACADQSGPAGELLGPQEAAFAKGGVKGSGGKGNDGEKAPKVKGKKKNGTTQVVELAVGFLPDIKDTKSQASIGPEGGCVETSGHFLCVPAGVMSEPAEFKISQAKRTQPDGTVMVIVDVKATRVVDGVAVSVGTLPEGFGRNADGGAKTVDLYLTYEWSTNRPKNKDGSLATLTTSNTSVMYFPAGSLDGKTEADVLPIAGFTTLKDKGNKVWGVVHVKLEHFSEYGIGWPTFF